MFLIRPHLAKMSSGEEEDDEHSLGDGEDGGPQQEDTD